jgi:PhzF family phenazine biosynthesis protein
MVNVIGGCIVPLPIYHVNAFVHRPGGGNPAAVCLLNEMPSDNWLQLVATQMNLSETAYLLPEGDAYRLRWFTPGVEVALCGHATLASAHVLWETGRLPINQPARFQTRSGLLTAERTGDWIDMDFPSRPAKASAPPPELATALGAVPKYAGQNGMDWLVEVESAAVVRSLRPDFAKLATLPVRGIIVTATSDDPAYDFISRFFAPATGVPEDPVTGSAHCCLTPFWSERMGKNELKAFQASARGGELRVRLVGNRVRLGGRAETVLRGELLL